MQEKHAEHNFALNKEGYSGYSACRADQAFLKNWHLITQDPWVLQVVQGFRLPLTQTPIPRTLSPEVSLAFDQRKLITEKVEELNTKEQ